MHTTLLLLHQPQSIRQDESHNNHNRSGSGTSGKSSFEDMVTLAMGQLMSVVPSEPSFDELSYEIVSGLNLAAVVSVMVTQLK